MNRRDMILGVTATALTAIHAQSSAQTDPESEWKVFGALAGLYNTLRRTGNAWADDITRVRLTRFLNGVQQPLNDLLLQKRLIAATIENPNCDPGHWPGIAGEATDRIPPLISSLQQSMRDLAGAVKPADIRASAFALTDTLGGLNGRKMWVREVDRYCQMNQDQRTNFRTRVENSVNLVKQARNELLSLLDKLD